MRSDSQFVRWGIPGWILVLSILFFVFLDGESKLATVLYNFLDVKTEDENLWSIFFVGIMTAGAGIPVGYIIYQIYFYLRWVSPISRDGFFPPLITGRMAEMEASLKSIEKEQLGFGKPWRDEIIQETADHRTFWYYINPLIHEVLTEIDQKGIYSKHLSYLKESLHSLGATSLSLLVGYVVYLILKVEQQELEGSLLPMVMVFVGVNFICLFLGDRNRLKQSKYQTHYTDILAELFTSTLIFVFAALNPFTTSKGLNFQIAVLLILLGIAWVISSKEDSIAIALSLLLAAGVSAIIYNKNLTFSDNMWAVFLSVIMFNIITISFAKTRRNTIESLTAYQHYVIRVYADKIGEYISK